MTELLGNSEQLSDCCQGPVEVCGGETYGDHVTNYYACTICDEPCGLESWKGQKMINPPQGNAWATSPIHNEVELHELRAENKRLLEAVSTIKEAVTELKRIRWLLLDMGDDIEQIRKDL